MAGVGGEMRDGVSEEVSSRLGGVEESKGRARE